ncbi:hypothetical protein ACIBCD_07650 [Nocardia brasiliensis]|uniref:hypothetical protein n=1 Tax=Nocardia brasiliensis TaxID=37326 RepID=UPI002453E139|nr:hypothetical protein [Nocardia brasiliensis]
MRIRIVVAAFGAALVLVVSAVGLHYYDGGSRDHTHLQVGDCWDYSARTAADHADTRIGGLTGRVDR